MRSQQQAERAEQQRIKNLVLNYDLTDDQHDGEDRPSFRYVMSPTSKRTRLVGTGLLNQNSIRSSSYAKEKESKHGSQGNGHTQHETSPVDSLLSSPGDDSALLLPPSDLAMTSTAPDGEFADGTGQFDQSHGMPKQDKAGNSRSKQRARKLQLGDFDWYGDKSKSRSVSAQAAPPEREASLEDFVKKSAPDQRAASASTSSRGRGGGQRGKREG